MPRLFVAIDPPDKHRERLATIRDDDLHARWSRRNQFHLTLRFLGETDAATTAQVTARLATIEAVPIEVRTYEGLDAFPSKRRPRVLIVRQELTPPLRALQEAVEAQARTLGFEPERRDFKPHLTLARLKRASHDAVRSFLQRHQDFQLPPFKATQYHLYESELHPDGARYRRLRSFSLGT